MEEKSNDDLCHRKGKRESSSGVVKSRSQINAEYFQALEQWLNDVRSFRYPCNIFPGFPYGIMGHQNNRFSGQSGNNVPPPNPAFVNLGLFTYPPLRTPQVPPPQQSPQQQQQQQQQQGDFEGIEYTIPPFWKRFVAEMVDFILLFTLKLAITFIVVDFVIDSDLADYDIQQQDKSDYKIAIELTSRILSLEILFKCLACVYEAFFLRKGMSNQMGGATPGKTLMGIRVVLCSSVEAVPNRPNVVKVYPATDLGLSWAFARAVLKNLVLAVLLPICFPFLFNTHNRTTYDILCHCVVVEDRVEPNHNR